MSGPLQGASVVAIDGNESGFGISRIQIRSIVAVMRAAQRLWPANWRKELAARADCRQRTVELWLEGRHNISADKLAALLRSDAGLVVLEELMGEARPAWWRDLKRQSQISQLRKRQEQQRQLLDRLEKEAGE